MLFRNIIVKDKYSKFHNESVDILIENKHITAIDKTDKIVNTNNVDELYLNDTIICPGFVAVDVRLEEPGNEHRETISSMTKAAISGGFTELILIPETNPFINKNTSDLIQSSLLNKIPLNSHIILPAFNEDDEIFENEFLTQKYCLGFYIHELKLEQLEALNRLFLTASQLNKPLFITPYISGLAPNGVANDDLQSLMNGLLPIPQQSETLAVKIILDLAQKHQTKIIFSPITLMASLELISKSKNDKIFVSTSSEYISFSNKHLYNFDTRFKCYPILRSEEDRLGLIKGINSNLVDFGLVRHIPRTLEETEVEFNAVKPGSVQLETAFAAFNHVVSCQTSIDKVIDLFSSNIRQVFNLKKPVIEVGQELNFTLIKIKESWAVTSQTLFSKSANCIHKGRCFDMKPLGILNHNGYLTVNAQ